MGDIMKIFFDHQIFNLQKYGGISRYFYELYNELNKERFSEITAEIPILTTENHYLKNSSFYNIISPKISYYNKHTKKIFNYFNYTYSYYTLRLGDYDIFHPTYYSDYFLDKIGNKPFVLTIYDMIHEKFSGEFFSETDKTISKKKLLAKEADKIIAISESTKNDIIEFYDISAEKIKVIYLGNSMKSLNNKKNRIDNDYILYVGNRKKYKNFKFFLKSVYEILKRNNLSLFCAGGGKFDKGELDLINSLNLEEFVYQKDVDESELSLLYNNAEAFIFPSLYEGFGIPILESFSMGCPAILSNTSSLPEVGGEAAIYFDPRNEESIKNTVEKVINDFELRKSMIRKGYNQLEKFSWSKTAADTLELYRSVINK
jgi:glycosyltransferase involved in cell wall biosynthesis